MPIRTCVVCRKKFEKIELIRIVLDENNKAIFDENQKENKRAIYLCNDSICKEKLKNMIQKGKFKLKIKDKEINMESLEEVLEK